MVPRKSKKKDGQMEVGSFGPRLIYSEHGSVSLSIAPIDVAYNAGAFRRPLLPDRVKYWPTALLFLTRLSLMSNNHSCAMAPKRLMCFTDAILLDLE